MIRKTNVIECILCVGYLHLLATITTQYLALWGKAVPSSDGETLMSLPSFRAGVGVLVLSALAACTQPDPLNTAGRRDGTPGNPPGTATSRALDRAGDPLNTAGTPDGTPGNPSGTAASRTLDRTAGTNTSGAYPSQSDGTRANPRGTAVSRSLGTTNR